MKNVETSLMRLNDVLMCIQYRYSKKLVIRKVFFAQIKDFDNK